MPGRVIIFSGPTGGYAIAIPDGPPFEDRRILVDGAQGRSEWHVEIEETDATGMLTLSGMTSGTNALWFELRLGEVAEIRYWRDRVIVRTDKAHASA